MTTTLLAAEQLLSKALGDYWSSTTTSAGATDGTTLVDTELKAKAEDWITDAAYNMITSGTYDEEERKISSLDSGVGALTVLAHGGQIATSVTYRIHRLFSASEKRRALIHAAKAGYPYIFEEIRDETKVSGNWLKDGSFEIWTSATALTHWTDDGTVILAKTTTSPYYKHGLTSCKLDTAAGYIHQDITNWDDLKHLAGKAVTFTVQGHCDTASCLRLAIYDGTTTTYSSYHDGDSAWTEHNDSLEVKATIGDNPTSIEFRIYHDVAAGTSYIDDARIIGGYLSRIYIGDLNLAQNKPHQVLIEPSDYSTREPWLLIHNYEIDVTNGYLYLPASVSRDYRLRILGIGYLNFVDSSGDSSTAWDSTIDIDSPQTEILVAEAAIYLCNQMIVPNQTLGTSELWKDALGYWKAELRDRQGRFGIVAPAATTHWR